MLLICRKFAKKAFVHLNHIVDLSFSKDNILNQICQVRQPEVNGASPWSVHRIPCSLTYSVQLDALILPRFLLTLPEDQEEVVFSLHQQDVRVVGAPAYTFI
jgi:hypothetical protein